MPEKLTSATVGRSSTMITSTSSLTCRRTSLNRPSPNSDRIAEVPLSSLYWSPMRNGSDANTVPGSTRCRPSTRMSLSVNGSTAQAGKEASRLAAMEVSVRPRSPRRMVFMDQKWSARQSGHIVEQGHSHHRHQDGHAPTLEAFEPDVRYRSPRDTFPKIIHQVPPIEDGQGQQVQHTQADADQCQEHDVLGDAHAGRLARIFGDGQRPAQVPDRGLSDDHAPHHFQRQPGHLPGALDSPAQPLDG